MLRGAVLPCLLWLAGCSTIINRPQQSIAVSTFPPKATLAVACGPLSHFEAATPATVPVSRSAVPCEISASRSGHETTTVSLQRRVTAAFWANLLWAGALTVAGYAAGEESDGLLLGLAISAFGMSIDASTGAMFHREPADIEIVLPPLEQAEDHESP
jgi:hypothetical protein